MRYYTFRFFHRVGTTARTITIASSEERDALAAAWEVIGAGPRGQHCPERAHWRLTSVIIRPVVDLADALAV